MAARLRRLAKTALAYGRLGLRGLGRPGPAGPAPAGARILLYHRVLPREQLWRTCSSPHIVVAANDFDRQMALLARHAVPMPLARIVEHVREGRQLPPGAAAVTFDDGWADNLTHALPILARHGIPATVFPATDFIGTDRVFWQERLRFLLECPEFSRLSPEIRAALGLPGGNVSSQALIAALKTRPPGSGDALAEALDHALGCSPDFPTAEHAMLSWDELRALRDAGLAIGSHGASHAILTGLSLDDALAECRASRDRLARELGQAPATLAYPNGDVNGTVIQAARAAGYDAALAIGNGRNTAATDLFALARINVGLTTFAGPGQTMSDTRFLERLTRP